MKPSSSPCSGRLITLEGGEGVGKSTNVRFVAEYLQQRGIDVVCTREPGGSPRAEKMREILLDPDSEPLDPMAELLLVFAARAQHWAMTVRPALERGAFVVCDRFIDASYAYQGAGRGIDFHAINMLETMVLGEQKPDLTLLLDMSTDTARTRVLARGQTLDRFEDQAGDFFQLVRQGYLRQAAAEPSRIQVIDASESLSVVQVNIAALLDQRLQQWMQA